MFAKFAVRVTRLVKWAHLENEHSWLRAIYSTKSEMVENNDYSILQLQQQEPREGKIKPKHTAL